MASVTNQISSAVKVAAITPTDATELPLGPCRGIYVGGAGNVALVAVNDFIDGGLSTATTIFVGVPAGTILPVYTAIVAATGTTATNLVALY